MFKWDPAEYQDNSANQLKWGTELITKLKLAGKEHVLDIGCGVGNITALIAKEIPAGHVIGIDSSPEMIEQAHKNYPEEKNPHLSFRVMDADKLTFHDEFDAVFSNAALHWIKDHLPVLKGIGAGLRHCGRVVLQMGGKGNAVDILKTMDNMIKKPQWSPYFNHFDFVYGFYGPGEYHSWLEQAGLEPIRIELMPKDMTHETSEKFASWIRTTWLPYTQSVPPGLREIFIKSVALEYLKSHPMDENGQVHVKMSRLEVEAVKP
jgi:trans-aconitate 2-methyltransferase